MRVTIGCTFTPGQPYSPLVGSLRGSVIKIILVTVHVSVLVAFFTITTTLALA